MDTQNQPNQPAQISPEIRTFLEGLLEDAGMTSLDDEMREQMIQDLYQRLDNFLSSVIVENMPPEHLDEFVKMNEEGRPPAEIQQFFSDNLPNAQDVMAAAFVQFRDLYLGKTPESEAQA